MKTKDLTKKQKSIIGIVGVLFMSIAVLSIYYFHENIEEISLLLMIVVIIMSISIIIGILVIYLANHDEILENFD